MKKLYFYLISLCLFGFLVTPQLHAQDDGGGSDSDMLLFFTPYNDSTDPPPIIEDLPGEIKMASRPTVLVTPNPTSDVTFKVWYHQLVGISRLEIVDIKGQVHYSTQVGSERERTGMLPLNSLDFAAGLYFVRLTSGAYTSVARMLVN